MPSQILSVIRILLAVGIAMATLSAVEAQSLDRVRERVRQPGGSSASGDSCLPAGRNSRSRNSDIGGYASSVRDDDDQNILTELIGHAFLAAAVAPFVVPKAILDDDGERGYFPDYPYDHDGAVRAVSFEPERAGMHSSLLTIQGSYGLDFDDMNHAHGRIFGDYKSRFGIDSEFFYRHENVPSGNDELWNGDFNLTYRFAQNESWQFRAGLGVNWLRDRFGSDAGFNTTYSVEWFPGDPVVVTGLIDWGRIGDTSIFHYRTTAGVSHNGWGMFTGYDVTRISDQSIHAWINGVEYRF